MSEGTKILAALSAVMLIFGMFLGQMIIRDILRADAIKHGVAYYHPETGEFTWKTLMEMEGK